MFREEVDSIGSKRVPREAYYGVQSLRGYENFRITGLSVEESFIRNLAIVKKACAISNFKADNLEENIKDAIVKSCDEIIEGEFIEDFIIDPIQGGAGTSMNMNINEIIANRANEILGYGKGLYYPVHPNDHVNKGQSTNDVIPTAGSLTAYKLLKECLRELKSLRNVFYDKSEEFSECVKMGRTEMQDAVPITLGEEFRAYANVLNRDVKRIRRASKSLLEVNLGGTAIGTGITATYEYMNTVVSELGELMDLPLNPYESLIDGTQNVDKFVEVSGVLKTCAVNMGKISGDLILMSSGPRAGFNEIELPAKQNGSSIMPGKVNPVMPELMKQISYQIMGNDFTISMAAESGQLELNAFCPIIFFNLFQSIKILKNGINTFIENCAIGIKSNDRACKNIMDRSIGVVTGLVPHIGYEKSAYIAKKALKEDKCIKDIVMDETKISEYEIDEILDYKNMINVS